MEIKKVSDSDVAALIEFNRKHFPFRDNSEEYVPYRCLKHPYLQRTSKETLIAIGDDNAIIGQVFLVPMKLRYEGVVRSGVWGMDFLVDGAGRSSQAGLALVLRSMENENLFGIGLSEVSLRLHLALKMIVVGHVGRYFKITGWFRFFYQFVLNKRKDINRLIFPGLINTEGVRYLKVEDPAEITNENGFYNDDMVEFSRDNEFIKWRFYNSKNKYFIYRSSDSKSFFAVRPIVWKKMNCLLLVDYKMKTSDIEIFGNILKAVMKLSRELGTASVLTGCSLPDLSQILKQNRFIKFGNDLKIVSNSKIFIKNKELKSVPVFVTFADSDSDFNY
jgi:hypothetical protein